MTKVPESEWPKRTRGLALGLGAGLLAGALLGCGEALVILRSSAADPDYGVLVYGTLVYALIFGVLGAGLGFTLAWSGRLMQRTAAPEPLAYARTCAAFVAAVSFAIGAFRLRRDFYHEELVWKSVKGLGVLAGCALSAVVLYALLALALRLLAERKPGRFLLRAWGTPALVVALGLGLFGFARAAHHAAGEPELAARPKAPPEAGNILFIVIDTLRADHLPLYGYQNGNTPQLDAFGQDAIRFEAAFANASWTRPSFASMLSGRYAASHRTMAKGDALPDEIVTLPEALRDAGYTTRGIATNYNVAPFFNFHQGFDVYRYLEPNFVLGANDTAAKLLLVQFMRQRIETLRAKSGQVEVGSAYQDASVVNKHLLGMLDQPPRAPWFMFVGYMDPHDPYYPHPYDGTAYSRAAHQEPNPDEAPALRKLYDGEISYWDEHFGQLVAELKRRGVYDELTIVITSDHGEEFHEHGGFWHGTTLYDEQVRVPLLVKLPGGEMRGNVVRHWVQSIDLMPTLLKRAGVAIPPGVQGRELFAGNTEVFAEESHEGNVLRALRIDRGGAQLKLITANPGNPRGLAEREFYRVDQDPREQVNQAAEEPALVEFSQKALDQHERDASQGRASQQSVDIASDENAAARLRALGYAGGDKPN
jgi:arylsulfatase A-like enzyme